MAISAVVLAGCEVDASVSVRMERDGSGVVTATIGLDAAAVERIERIGGGPLEGRFRIDDLLDSGWQSEGWRRDGAEATLILQRAFESPEQAVQSVRQLTGETGILSATAGRGREGFRESERIAVTVDLGAAAPGVVTDADLARALEDLGVDATSVDLLLTAELVDAFELTTMVALGDASDTATVSFGETAMVSVEDDRLAVGRIVAVGAGSLLGVVGLVLLAIVLLTASRRRSRTTAGP